MAESSNKRTAAVLGAIVLTMGALAWAAVPMYDWFCRTTGYGGTTQVAEVAPTTVLDREITIRFDANVELGMPWEFKPVEREMTLKIGETGLAFFEAYNPTDEVIAGTASYHVSPDVAGYYFSKIQCFCFDEQILQPHERVLMPVSFFVDPGILDDRDAWDVRHITLSYTFHRDELPQDQAALSPAQSAPYN